MLCNAFTQRNAQTLALLPCLFRSYHIVRMLPAGEESLVRGDRVVGRWLVRVVVEELGERRRRRARRDKDGEGFVIDVVCDLSVSR
jgi:hypothetical protein